MAWTLAATLVLAGCHTRTSGEESSGPPLFELLAPETTGITFANMLPTPDRPELNILNYLYYYNGGGVAVGDVDNDGLQDLYFSSNLESNRLYKNLGNNRFEDITINAGVGGPPGWKTGVTMADVNGDGFVDIHVSAVRYRGMEGRNVLYVNDGDGTFTDRTREFGLEFSGFATQVTFFDYDADGDLDMYLLTHSTHTERAIGTAASRHVRHASAGDRLYRNDGARFTDVSEAAGIFGGVDFGLGVVASDLNVDGCVDLYVANDFQEDDLLYHNNCDGTFTETVRAAMAHTSRFSMGVDASDFDNDGLPDLMVVDMLPEREEILKTSASSESFNLFDLRLRAGYHPQYARNTLQRNRGLGRFSDVGYLAGVSATDWSWAPLFADLDNDGWKDLFITDGIYRRPNDLDYINYIGNDAVQASLAREVTSRDLTLLERMPRIPLANHAYRNNGDLTFTDQAQAWGLAHPAFSNGAAYVDLDNDGALDLVVNRINAPVAIYRSRARALTPNASLTIALRGSGANTAGVGARIVAVHDTTRQTLEQSPTRGFQSSVDPRLHLGVGTSTRLDSLVVIWPDRRYQVLRDIAVNRTITLWQDSASGRWVERRTEPRIRFQDLNTQLGVSARHVENAFLDYNREPLMPHLLSTEGPALAVGDVNGDGLDDIFVGGAKWQGARVLVQQADGRFRESAQKALGVDSLAEDVDATLFDADGDGDLDLYVVSGGNEFWGDAEALRDRLYVNDGRGGFQRAPEALPAIFHNGACVAPADFDGDGDIDLFVGSRVVAREYGTIPESHLLRNDGSGRFTDVTRDMAPALARAGMVTSAAWLDTDGDRALDLVVVGEWMPVTVFRQEGGRFVDRTEAAGFAGSEGWWNSVEAADLDADGRLDLVLGNLGLNSYVKASAREPAQLFVHDFGGTGVKKQVLTFFKHGLSYPLAGRDEFVRLIPALRSRYPNYVDFGASRYEDIFTAAERGAADVRTARTFASVVARNRGDGTFVMTPLPNDAQIAPVFASLAFPIDGDSIPDLVLGGNFHGVPPIRGRYDASYGAVLRGRGDGTFVAMELAESGLVIEGEVRAMKRLRHASGRTLIAVARNNAPLLLLRPESAMDSPRVAGATAPR